MDFDAVSQVALALLVPWALRVTVVDVRHRRIPVRLQILGSAISAIAVSAAVLTGARGERVWVSAAAGAVFLFLFYLVLRMLAPTQLGGGDLRIAPAVGAIGGLSGMWGIAVVGIAPFAVTAVIGLFLAGRGIRHVPHGPSMVGCSLLVALQVV